MNPTYFLTPGQTMSRGDCLVRGPAKLCFQSDGNLVASVNGKAVGATGTRGADKFAVQPDGNVTLSAGKQVLWQTGTAGKKGAQLNLATDGTIALYVPAPGGKWTSIWDSKKHPLKDSIVRSKGSGFLLPDPMKIVKSVGHAASDVVHLKVQKAVKDLGKGVNQITGSQIIQAAFPVAAPANILNGAVTGGKAGALKAASSFLKNPVAKATYAAVGLVFPPVAPITAGAVAGMEAASRVLDGIESKDPKAIAAAALQLASTGVQAASGVPGAKRALDTVSQVSKARDIAGKVLAGSPDAVQGAAQLAKKAATGDKQAQVAHHVLTTVMTREALKQSSSHPLAQAAKVAQPTLTAQVKSAMSSPQGVRLGKYSVLRTGRTLYGGKGIKHSARHKSAAAYSAYLKSHPAHH